MKRNTTSEKTTNFRGAILFSRLKKENATNFSKRFRWSRTFALAATAASFAVWFGAFSGCRAYMQNDREAELIRRNRGEYAVENDATTREWEFAAREAAQSSDGEKRVSVKKPIRDFLADADSVDSERDSTPTFGERVKKLFTWPGADKKEETFVDETTGSRPTTFDDRPDYVPRSSRRYTSRDSNGSAVANSRTRSFDRFDATSDVRSTGRSVSSRSGEALARYDESRFIPSYRMIQQYYSPSGSASGDSANVAIETSRIETERRSNSQNVAANAPLSSEARLGAPDVARSSGLGSTRSISIVQTNAELNPNASSQEMNVSAAYSTSRSVLVEPQTYLSVDSIFGFRDAAAALAFAVAEASAPDVSHLETQEILSDDFASQLGETSFSWFNGSSAEPQTLNESKNSPAVRVERIAAIDNLDAPRLRSVANIETGESYPVASLASPIENSSEMLASSVENPVASLASPIENSSETLASSVENPVESLASPLETPVETFSAAPLANFDLSFLNDNFSLETSSGVVSAFDLSGANVPAATIPIAIPESVDERKNSLDSPPPTVEEIAWLERIEEAIQTLADERNAKKARGEDVRADDARLRLLYLAIGEYDRAIHEIQDESDPLKVFWEKECRGLEVLLQDQTGEIEPETVAERLRSGLDSFAQLCDLQIAKAILAVAPACFGLYEERIGAFKPGDVAYIYSELDYVVGKKTDAGYEIAIECRWRLLDANGQERTPIETQRCANLSETKLRDVVLNLSVPLPKTLEPGTYLLELEVVDTNAVDPKTATRRLNIAVEK